jgi:protein gp37
MQHSNITWTQATMNSLYGCTQCSEGCTECYAKSNLVRFSANPVLNSDHRFDELVRVRTVGDEQVYTLTGRILFNPSHLYSALGDSKPKRVFVNEFSDVLHESLPLDLILEHFRVFARAPQHVFQILTKRGKRLAEINDAVLTEFGAWPRNVHMGVSVCTAEDRELQRIHQLGTTEAALRWISFEPWISNLEAPLRTARPALRALLHDSRIAWVVIGGESGAPEKTGLMTLDDARYLIEESRAAGSRVFFKQLGTALAIQLGVYSTQGKGEHRSKGGHPDQWPADLNVQEYPDPLTVTPRTRTAFHPAYDPEAWLHFRAKNAKVG